MFYSFKFFIHICKLFLFSLVPFFIKADKSKVEAAEMTIKEEFSTAKTHWADQERLLKADVERLQGRVKEMEMQNSLLHDELQQMSQQMTELQQHAAKDDKVSTEKYMSTFSILLF